MSDILSTLPEEIQKDIHKNRPDHPITYGIITISEGKKRQIRRMMKSVHCCVIELKRISIGDIVLDESLRPGEWKEIFRTLTIQIKNSSVYSAAPEWCHARNPVEFFIFILFFSIQSGLIA